MTKCYDSNGYPIDDLSPIEDAGYDDEMDEWWEHLADGRLADV